MRITDLLDKRSINLNAAPKTKSEALDMAVENLWQRAERLMTSKATGLKYMQEKKKVQQVWEKE